MMVYSFQTTLKMPNSVFFAFFSYFSVKICSLFTILRWITNKAKENQNKTHLIYYWGLIKVLRYGPVILQRKGIRTWNFQDLLRTTYFSGQNRIFLAGMYFEMNLNKIAGNIKCMKASLNVFKNIYGKPITKNNLILSITPENRSFNSASKESKTSVTPQSQKQEQKFQKSHWK